MGFIIGLVLFALFIEAAVKGVGIATTIIFIGIVLLLLRVIFD
jgi:hypothetical protein